MLKTLSDNVGIKIIAEIVDADQNISTRFVGGMEIHEGRHRTLGRIAVIRESGGSNTVIVPAPRPILTLAKSEHRAA